MMEGLHSLEEGRAVLPFVRQFYGVPSSYLWEDDGGVTHIVTQGEGGEEGDALMPLLFYWVNMELCSLWLLQCCRANVCLPFLMTFMWCARPRECLSCTAVCDQLCGTSPASANAGKTQLWNRAGEEPPGCQHLTVEARLVDPTAVVWKGGEDVPQGSRGIPRHSIGPV